MRCDSLSSLYLWHIKYSMDAVNQANLAVVIRFQVCIFDILNTAGDKNISYSSCCDSLSSLYLWHIKYSDMSNSQSGQQVVIRFQVCIFDILNTAQPLGTLAGRGCDSLSSLYLWHIKYSSSSSRWNGSSVVIRFQVCIFDILNTAEYRRQLPDIALWFAFKFVSLTY